MIAHLCFENEEIGIQIIENIFSVYKNTEFPS